MNQRRVYSADFKRKVVQMALTTTQSQAALEREFGIGAGCLCRWLREFTAAESSAFPGQGRRPVDESEVALLRRELHIAREEISVLKKALVLVSQSRPTAF